MDINIIAGKNSEINNNHIFSVLKNRDKTKKHIIVAPDRSLFSLEQRLFDETGESCFFDVSITSISKLSKKILNNIKDKNILTKQSGVALVKKLLHDNKDKLTTFKKSISYMGFATSLYETICLYKSCNISCDDVFVDDSTNHFNLKQKDIKLIYSEYEKFLKIDFTDSFNQLVLFTDKIDREFCKDTIFYFVEFDDFTSIMYGIISKLARFSDKFYITCHYGKENKNNNIYSNKVYYDLIALFRAEGLNYSINKVNYLNNSIDSLLANNLLAYNPNTSDFDNDKIKINVFDNARDEIKYTIAEIYSKVMKDTSLTFSDFAIVLPNLNELPLIKRELSNYDIPYFVDVNDILVDHVLIRNLIGICKIISGDFDTNDFLNIIKSVMLAFDEESITEYDNYLKKIGARGYECLSKKELNDEHIIYLVDLINEFRNKVKENLTWSDYLNEIILPIFNYLIDRSQDFVNNLNSIDSRIFNQVLDKFESINKDFVSVFEKNETSFAEFLETYISYFETTNISLPPISSNSLFLADFNSSYISTYKNMYIFSCNEGIMPKLKLDNGLITDEEIARLPNASQINPTISMLNSRKVFKLFDLIFKAKNNLTISYLQSNQKGKLYPNNLVLSLSKILNISIENKSVVLDQINNSLNSLDRENIVINNLTEENSIYNILSLKKAWETYKHKPNYLLLVNTLIDANNDEYLQKLLDNLKVDKKYDNLENAELFKNNITSVSQIESYYNCPYMHFARYGLRLNKKKEYKFESNDIGTIIHNVLKELVPKMLDNMDNEESIIKAATEILNNILRSEEYVGISQNPVNAYIIKSLYKEIGRVCLAVMNELRSSEFKPSKKYLEYSFDSNQLIINGIKIRGTIDRVDIKDSDFIIIDYKTGSNNFSNYNEVYSGKKLQLLVYARAFEKQTKMQLKGLYYFPLSNAFAKDNSEFLYRFNGVTYKSTENICAIDRNLAEPNTKSRVLNLATNKDGEFYNYNTYKYMCLEKEELDYLVSFAIKQVEKAIANIISGNINPRPIVNGQYKTCDYCEYKGLCNYQDNNDFVQQTISSIEVLKTKEGINDTK